MALGMAFGTVNLCCGGAVAALWILFGWFYYRLSAHGVAILPDYLYRHVSGEAGFDIMPEMKA
jgi:hypothetical protein